MTSIVCNAGGVMHSHESVEGVRTCYAGSRPVTGPVTSNRGVSPHMTPRPGSTAPAQSATGGLSTGAFHQARQVRQAREVRQVRDTSALPTQSQLDYAKSLGGDERATRLMNRGQVSDYIRVLKDGAAVSVPVNAPQQVYTRPERARAKLSNQIIAMLKTVDDGYYAWQPDTATPLVFIRIKLRKGSRTRNLNGARVIASQHGPDFTEEAFVYPSDSSGYLRRCNYFADQSPFTIEGSATEVEDALIGIIVDKYKAARTYALEKGRCCRCHKDLTDRRSRWYGIGPDCEDIWPGYLEEVHNEKGMTYDEADRLGLVS